MEAQSGKITALIGASGKGKTSTLRLLLGLIKPKDGKITVSNESGDQIALSASTRELFSYVPQNNTIFSGTIAENLRLVKQDATDEELEKVLRDACAWEFVSKLPDAMNTTVTERGQCFSDGQNQRLSIARALLADTPILLLDEATSALDVATEKEVLSNILRNNRNRMIILTSPLRRRNLSKTARIKSSLLNLTISPAPITTRLMYIKTPVWRLRAERLRH